MGDFKENVYTGRYAKRLAMQYLNMTEQCHKTTKQRLPATSNGGSRPIYAIFATAGVVCISACLLARYGGICNHRSFILDFTSASLIGKNFPNIMAARLLHCELERLVNNYTKALDQLCDQHNMYRRITSLYKHAGCLLNADFLLLIDKWGDELTVLMKCAENKCNTYKHCHIEWSPEVGVWLQHQWLLARVLQFMNEEIPDPRNLIRDCKKHNLEDTRLITLAQLHLEIHVCNLQITSRD